MKKPYQKKSGNFDIGKQIRSMTLSSVLPEYGGGYMISGIVDGEKRINRIKGQDLNFLMLNLSKKKSSKEVNDIYKKYLIDEFDPETDKLLKTKKKDLENQIYEILQDIKEKDNSEWHKLRDAYIEEYGLSEDEASRDADQEIIDEIKRDITKYTKLKTPKEKTKKENKSPNEQLTGEFADLIGEELEVNDYNGKIHKHKITSFENKKNEYVLNTKDVGAFGIDKKDAIEFLEGNEIDFFDFSVKLIKKENNPKLDKYLSYENLIGKYIAASYNWTKESGISHDKLKEEDSRILTTIYDAWMTGNIEKAYFQATKIGDTYIREAIPSFVWEKIGGEISNKEKRISDYEDVNGKILIKYYKIEHVDYDSNLEILDLHTKCGCGALHTFSIEKKNIDKFLEGKTVDGITLFDKNPKEKYQGYSETAEKYHKKEIHPVDIIDEWVNVFIEQAFHGTKPEYNPDAGISITNVLRSKGYEIKKIK